ncbi:MAG: PD40 domain-containing protein [bacterium]|nr:PD40 domain-containing protein [bacterium]
MLDLSTGESRQWTSGEHTDRHPVWSRDGQWLTFFRHEKGEDRIYRVRRGLGTPELLWKGRGVLAGLEWGCEDSCLVVKFRKADPTRTLNRRSRTAAHRKARRRCCAASRGSSISSTARVFCRRTASTCTSLT